MIRNKPRLTPKNYKGTALTAHHVKDVLPLVMSEISSHYGNNPEQVIAMWPQVLGPKLAGMTKVISFFDGILRVSVKNSTLLSLLKKHEKARLLAIMQKRLPHVDLQDIRFQIG